MMRRLARVLSFGAGVGSSLLLIRRLPRGPAQNLLLLKVLAGPAAPWLALAGSLGTALGLARRDPAAVLAGMAGAAVAARHIRQVSAPHARFAVAFGPAWEAGIPPARRARLVPTRYRLRPRPLPAATWARDVVIGIHHETGDLVRADLWQPPPSVPRTGLAVVYLHGSAWHFLDKDWGTRPFFRHLAGQGHVVLDVAYTLAPKAQLAPMVADVRRAVLWMKTHAARHGIRPDRIVLMGGSSGGHLALLAAYTADHPALRPPDVTGDASVRAVVSYYGTVDLRATHLDISELDQRGAERFWPLLVRAGLVPPVGQPLRTSQLIPSLIGGPPEAQGALYDLGSPIYHVRAGLPPTLLLQGAHDTGMRAEHTRRLYRALRTAGTPAVYVEYPATEHAFDLFMQRWSPPFQASLYDTERFLALMAG